MKTITRALIGTGLAGTALLGVMAPSASAAEGDRLSGPFVTHESATGGEDSIGWSVFSAAVGSGERFVGTIQSSSTPPANADVFTMPAQGETGPIIDKNGLCVTAVSTVGAAAVALPCDGRESQQFSWDVGQGSWEGQPNLYTTYSGSKRYVDYHSTEKVLWMTSAGLANAINTSVLSPVAESTPVDITTPADGSTIEDTTPAINGTGEPGATVVVTDGNGKELGTTTVAEDGTWTVTPANPLPNGMTKIVADQTTEGGDKSQDTTTVTIVDGELDTPVVNPGVGVAAASVIGLAGLGLLARRKKAANQA